MADTQLPNRAQLARWFAKLAERDPKLHSELTRRLRDAQPVETEGLFLESRAAGAGAPPSGPDMVLETIVLLEGRPALLVQDSKISTDDESVADHSREVVDRLLSFAPVVEPILPLVGRIDVENHVSGAPYLGTGWLVDEDVVVTNRHVAELIARHGPRSFRFVPGRFGDPIRVSVNYGREFDRRSGESAKVEEVLFIEEDGAGPDIAFLRVARRTDGTSRKRIELAADDAEPGEDVAVIGYPARAPSSAIPDQAAMDRIYGHRYDVKRIAPGLMDDPSRGWSTHDCTTLGGASGAPVVAMRTGEAVALHFAGLYMVENYAVQASTIRKYLGRKPWPYRLETSAAMPPVAGRPVPQAAPGATATAQLTLNIPIIVSVALDSGALAPAVTNAAAVDVEQAAELLAQQLRGDGVRAIRAGLAVENGALFDEPCVVVAAHPDRVEEVRARAPGRVGGFRVQVRPASIDDQLGEPEALLTEAPVSIAYDDDARTGPAFRLEWVEEPMKLRCHVGPERSFEELAKFLAGTSNELVSSMYQFHAEHVRQAVDRELKGASPAEMTLVVDPQTRDHGEPAPAGQFSRSKIFEAWAKTGKFKRIYVPEGKGGLVDNAYHIKVTVRDGEAVWLSSGNWTRSSQPMIPVADRLDPAKTSRAGNREWHVVAESPTLAERFRSHILRDFETCGDLGGTPEAVGADLFVDVPIASLESILLEAPPTRVFEPLVVDRKVRVHPLLTPDGKGAVYCDAVLELIRSARKQLLFQNQYINVTKHSAGRFGDLVDALVKASKDVEDYRIILRSNGSGFWDKIAELRRRGLDVTRHVRRLANTHTKGIVVDGQRVLVGSHNWSASGVTFNRDASLIFDDAEVAGYYAGIFEADWNRANPLSIPEAAPVEHAPRIATGPEPPPGFARMPLAEYLEG